jgi:hypothetical protein
MEDDRKVESVSQAVTGHEQKHFDFGAGVTE